MITAVDSTVLLDILTDDPNHVPAAMAALALAKEQGALVVCPVVWAEVRATFERPEQMADAFEAAEISFDPFTLESADLAGEFWKEYRRMGGSREHLIPDFLIAAHAQCQADALLTRDRGFFRRYFSDLTVILPAEVDSSL